MAENINNKAIWGSLWVILGFGTSQVLRLGGNLIVTRLLVPEYFGIMAIAQVFLQALFLFSDLGLAPGVIRSDRSDDPKFYNTAWTLQIIRGIILWVLTFLIAIPIASIYNIPILAKIIPFIGFSFLISGFDSTAIFALKKRIELKQITLLELTSQGVQLIVMVSLAYFYRNVWALAIGGVVAPAVKTIISHFLMPERKSYVHFDRDSAKELISFGIWIFVSTSMMFLATQADRILLGKLFPLGLFGIYNVAVMFAELPKQVMSKLGDQVIFPLMTHFSKLPREKFRQNILSKRKKILLPLTLIVGSVASFGDLIIFILYDNRYHEAGWMLPMLAVGMWPFLLCVSIDRCFYALGKPKIPAVGNFFKFIYMITVLPLFFHFFGVFGGVLAVTCNDLPIYIVNNIGLHRARLSCIKQDLLYTAILILIIITFISLRSFLGLGIPGEDFFMH